MSTSATEPTATAASPTWRIAPSLPVAIGVFIAYVVVFIGLSASSGIDYADWFATGGNAFRTAVVPLIGGCLVLIAFVLWARWDWVFKDPARLPMYGFLWVPVALFALGIVVHSPSSTGVASRLVCSWRSSRPASWSVSPRRPCSAASSCAA